MARQMQWVALARGMMSFVMEENTSDDAYSASLFQDWSRMRTPYDERIRDSSFGGLTNVPCTGTLVYGGYSLPIHQSNLSFQSVKLLCPLRAEHNTATQSFASDTLIPGKL